MIRPDQTTALIRFYSRNVICALVQCHEQEWHFFLFQDIVQWWAPSGETWQHVTITPSSAENARDHAIRLDEKTWQQIADKPEIGCVLAQWQKMSSSQHFPPCAQRDQVIKALKKARAAGMTTGDDKKMYAFYYLEGGKTILESAQLQASLQQVAQGTTSLEQILTHYTAE
ncbi:hypothetical protein SJI19_06415 [Acerihabitans sp. TG2]|uniref:hypothetical protein n=1 Tax=Acerihabitans sp. TG2 TaxID=3096008 RepID=UPI002B23388D|nr:hypothetical protein [Acerihabitans sp. TG2]MEA9390184.1 hypothetical protein [Acerihabitans sp. TG2]